MRTYQDLVAAAKARIREIDIAEARTRHERGGTVFLDVRESNEWNLGRIPGAVFIPRGTLERDIAARVPGDASVIVYCGSGNRSALAAETLHEMGYTDVASLADGWKGWAASGGAVED